jgi:hypothetical protein
MAVAEVGTSTSAVLSAIDIIEGEVTGAGRVTERATAARALAVLDESGFKKFAKGGAGRCSEEEADATG